MDQEGRPALLLETGHQQLRLGGLAGALAALQGYEYRFVLSAGQSCSSSLWFPPLYGQTEEGRLSEVTYSIWRSLSPTHITEMVGNFAAHLTRDEMAYGELVDEGHLNDRGFWVEVPHPELDRSFKYSGPAGIYNGSPWRISRRAPLIWEHNEEIYCGELGLQRTELAYLAESGVV